MFVKKEIDQETRDTLTYVGPSKNKDIDSEYG